MPPRFPPRVQRKHINNIPPMTQADLDWARKEFPEEKLASRALEKYARKHWIEGRYFWKDGFRHVCGSDIKYFTCIIPRYEIKQGPSNITYHVAKDVPTLTIIDRPKKKGLRILVAHQSEGEWALPKEHPRHLLNFPQEIIDMICRCVLTIKEHKITPDVTTSNSVKRFKAHQTYSLDGERSLTSDLSLSTVVTQSRQDHQGEYFELRKVYRPKIDATLLRVCKRFNKDATLMLYAENIFQFKTMDWTRYGSPWSWIDGKEKQYNLHEWPSVLYDGLFWGQPDLATQLTEKAAITQALYAIEKQEPFLVDHNICDHFFRFLHSIGKENSKAIKKLQFSGTVLLHRCDDDHPGNQPTKECNKDLIDSFRYYIPIINKFCKSLDTLVIEVYEDNFANQSTIDGLGLEGSPETQFQKLLSKFLEGDIRTLHSVKTLDIYRIKDENFEEIREEIDFAEPTIAWFKDRANA